MRRDCPPHSTEASETRGKRSARWRPALVLALALALQLMATPRVGAAAANASDPGELLAKLNSLSVDPSQVYFVRDLRLTRDRASIYLNRGFLGLLTPVNGEVTGAVFTGDGEILLTPPDSVEGQSLAWFTGSAVLEERFSSIYLRFTDASARELLTKAQPPDPAASEQPADLLPAWNGLAQRLEQGQSLRILQDLVSDRRPEYFSAEVQGLSLGAFELSVDERRPEAVQVMALQENKGASFVDVWCSFQSRAQRRPGSVWRPPLQVSSYRIDTRINPDKTLDGRAELDLESRLPERFLAFELSRHLEVTEVRDGAGVIVPVFQGALAQGLKPSERNDWVAVVLPKARPPTEAFRLTFKYRGGVIADVGNGVLYVGAHSNWYPNVGPSPKATYDLTFEYPASLTLVATGQCADESAAEGVHRSHCVSDGVFPMAGFNLGPYDVRMRDLGSVQVQVYASQEAEAALERRYLRAQAEAQTGEQAEIQQPHSGPAIPPVMNQLTPAALIGRMADGAAQTIRYFQTLFGPFPYPRLTISQIPGNFGQGWPELIYLPTFAFLPVSVRFAINAQPQNLDERVALDHEIAHQWWGNEVGWHSYHDQWLSEGFASYAAALSLAQQKDGDRLFRQLLRDYRRDLLAKNKEAGSMESEGPIWLGGRLSNSLEPEGYDDIVYKKACWVLHMLRLLLTDPQTGSDARFFQMLREFLTAYRGESPSTEDFVRHAEKYMTHAADLDRDKRLDWFFKEWVYSTDLPEYKLKSSTRRLASGVYQIEGTITQTGDRDFEMLVPVSVFYRSVSPRAARPKRLLVAVTGAGGHFSFTSSVAPERIAIDEDACLAVVD